MEHVSIKIVILNFIAFFTLLFVIWYIVWPKVNAFVEARQKKIEDLLNTYADRNAQAEKLMAELKRENAQAATQRVKFLEEAKHESEKLRQEIIDKAYFESSAMIDRAKIEIEAERKVMFSQLRENVSRIVVAAVEDILKNIVDKDLDKKIILETEKSVNLVSNHAS